MIVEVSFGPMYTMPHRQQVSHCVFGRSLSHRPRDSDGSLAPQLAHCCGEGLQRDQCVIHSQQANLWGIAEQLIFPDDGTNCALTERLLDEVMAVEALALDSKKKIATLNGT